MVDQVVILASSREESAQARRRLARRGYQVIAGDGEFPRTEVADGSSFVVLRVFSEDDAQSALIWAVTGYSLVLELEQGSRLGLQLIDDLGRIAPVQHAAVPARPSTNELSEVQVGLLIRLRDGATLTEAAASLFLSRRTANRRVAEARDFFGTRSHRETILAFADYWKDRPGLP